MAAPSLRVTRRERLGRHAASLRRDGRIPAVVYGHRQPALAIEADLKELERLYQRAGRTALIDLAVEGSRPRKVLIRELQFSPRTGRAIHVDFFAVNLTERIQADIPVVLVGEAPAVAAKLGVVIQVASTVRVETLPADIPSQLTADVSALTGAESTLTVADLAAPEGVQVLSDPGEVLAKISGRRVRDEAEDEGGADTEAAGEAEGGEAGAGGGDAGAASDS